MKIALLQNDIIWADPAANATAIRGQFSQLPQADLYVLPEMFSTGFATDPAGIAEESDNQVSLPLLKELAAQRDAAVAGSVSLHENGKYYNRFYFVKPDGMFTAYDKHHLFSYSGENKTFTPGNKRVVVEWRGVRFLLLVCYDLRFPVWSRFRGDYDAILYVASWPVTRIMAWNTLLAARAIENQAYVAAVNRVGSDPACVYSGHSRLVNPYGDVVAAARDEVAECVVGEIDMEFLNSFRAKFPALDDADKYTIE